MADTLDSVELVRMIADIASRTTDPNTARQLVELTDWLLTDVGLPRITRLSQLAHDFGNFVPPGCR